jgi:hypothetical protein
MLDSIRTFTKLQIHADKPGKACIGFVARDAREGLLSRAPIHLRTPLLVAGDADTVGFDARSHYLRCKENQRNK